jgi:PDZ domain-containing protein
MTRAACALLAAIVLGCGGRMTGPTLTDASIDANRARIAKRGIELYVARAQRLLEVSGRLRVKGAAVCGKSVRPFAGLVTFARQDIVWRKLRDVAASISSDYQRPTVLRVLPGSPAEAAGIRPGDVVRSVGGRSVQSSNEIVSAIDDSGSAPLAFDLETADGARSVEVHPGVACRHRVSLRDDDELEVQRDTDGSIAVSIGLLDFADGNDELAAIVAHAMGQDIAGMMPTDPKEPSEKVAPLAVALLRAGGFDAQAPERLWKRLAIEHPWEVLDFPGAMSLNQTNFPVRLGPLPARVVAYRDASAGK